MHGICMCACVCACVSQPRWNRVLIHTDERSASDMQVNRQTNVSASQPTSQLAQPHTRMYKHIPLHCMSNKLIDFDCFYVIWNITATWTTDTHTHTHTFFLVGWNSSLTVIRMRMCTLCIQSVNALNAYACIEWCGTHSLCSIYIHSMIYKNWN